MATKTTRTSIVKNAAKKDKTTAPKVARARGSGSGRTPAHDEIAARAFERYCARGYAHGHDVEDWLAAERELTQPA